MSLLALILGAVLSGSTVLEYGKQPLDIDTVNNLPTQVEQPLLEGKATWYDYRINGEWISKEKNTCAIRKKERYGNYKVCIKGTEKCITCYHNDYGPAEYTNKVIDLSSHAFKQLAPLSKGVIDVEVYKID